MSNPQTLSNRQLPFAVVTKPTGAACNLDCKYCFFLSKELLYNARQQTMSEATLELYIQRFLQAQPDGNVTMLWQGGEPTLRGLDFYKKALKLCDKYRRPGQVVKHALQTNGTLINAEWARFLFDNDFLVGISLDGPEEYHDTYRVNRAGRPTQKMVLKGWEHLQNYGVKCNILCTIHHANQDHGQEVYRYFRDSLGADFIQFIPIVERVNDKDLAQAEAGWRSRKDRNLSNEKVGLLYRQQGQTVTSRSVEPEKYGVFLLEVFNEWIRHDVGKVFVQDFDAALAAMFGQISNCVHAPSCGNNFALEFNADVYACD
ncbi:MAG: radical SAM protein, partial [Varibaculum cambriense]